MGEIADTLRSTLRQLAQADARLYRGLAEELGDGATAVEEPRALIQPEGGAPATEAQLLALKNDALQELCAQRGHQGAQAPQERSDGGPAAGGPQRPAATVPAAPSQDQNPFRWEGYGSYGRQGRHR